MSMNRSVRGTKAPILSSLILVASSATTVAAAPPRVGAPAPTFLGSTIRNQDVTVDAYRGRIVIVSFWSEGCGPCMKELPHLAAIQKGLGPDRVQVIAVNYKQGWPEIRRLRRQLAQYGLIITRDRGSKVADAYGVDALPNTFVIDKDGQLYAVHAGYSDTTLAKMTDELKDLLGPKVLAEQR